MKYLRIVRNFIKQNPHEYLALYLPIFLICFFGAEYLVPESANYWVSYTPLDDAIPFVEVFVLPYVCWYPFLILTGLYLLIFDGEQFRKYIYCIAALFTLILLICLIFPNGQNLRPDNFSRENIFTAVVAGLYAMDTNTNVFPSMHVAGAIAAAIPYFRSQRLRKYRLPAAVLAALISLSTVFIKQHSVLDIYGAVALCLIVCPLIYRRRRK